MDMNRALIAHLEGIVAAGRLPPDQQARVVDELHQVRRRVIRPRDTSNDDAPITVGTLNETPRTTKAIRRREVTARSGAGKRAAEMPSPRAAAEG